MAIEPDNEAVEFVESVTGLGRVEAIRWLKAYNNDANNAMNAYFENPDAINSQPLDSAWDENAFHSDKTAYGPPTQNQSSFTVHSQDTLNPGVFGNGLSRPPSRVSIRAGSDKNGGKSQHMSVAEQDEQNMQKAIADSMHQEVGVIEASNTQFGPALGTYYDSKNWTMTYAPARAQEILQNPELEYRRRQLSQPAFLKPSPAGHYLPALVTILHAVPIAREALLLRDHTLPDYGSGNEWWDGISIQAPRIVDLDRTAEEDVEWEDVIFESQRLMAFLDGTERAYGSADVLAHMEGLEHHNEIERSYLELWQKMVLRASPESELASIFESRAIVGDTTKDFSLLELRNQNDNPERSYSLYDAFDDALWNGFSAEDPDEVYLDKISDVFIIRADGHHLSNSGLGIKIPSVWYPDRYLKESMGVAREMRLGKERIKKEIDQIEAMQAKLTTLQGRVENIDARKLLNISKSYLLAHGNSEAAEELQAVADRVTLKFNALEQSKTKAIEEMRKLSRLYTKPADKPELTPRNRYTLRGVSTDHYTTYLVDRTRPDDAEDLLSAENTDWQWWKVSFSIGDAKPISITKVREVEVLKAAKDESQTALLVYASEKAVNHEYKNPPSQLINFVRADNLIFSSELDKTSTLKPTTSPKRKADESYDDYEGNSMAAWNAHESSSPKKVNGPSTANANIDYSSLPPPPPYTPANQPSPVPLSSLSRTSAFQSHIQANHDDPLPSGPGIVRSTTIDPSSVSLDDVDLNSKDTAGQEMEEKSGSLSRVLTSGSGSGKEIAAYALGSYKPEIIMDDMDDKDG